MKTTAPVALLLLTLLLAAGAAKGTLAVESPRSSILDEERESPAGRDEPWEPEKKRMMAVPEGRGAHEDLPVFNEDYYGPRNHNPKHH
ncbi:unnamed protein product [Spirodela intermedia]|uniref:Uncharacterized protein n=2 Tax=Spirodela intermedia TaxID=51605 RepID=A0A7I8LD91_SPIIN|nr:unnamed protein product [Spirodela intermedia]CAA6670215.1 unnamed protein product [Spirodela intermedia]CAA7407268.1 unnamed protein product [Spirodela intermedia]